MAGSTGTGIGTPTVPTFERMKRAYRVRTYRPARYYLTWTFIAAVLVTFLGVFGMYHVWQVGGLIALRDSMWYGLPALFAALFLIIMSTFYYLIAAGYFALVGDRGIWSLGTLPATHPVVTKASFIVSTNQQKAMYEQRLWGARITRYYVWRWGRLGGCKDWPGKAGGKSEGYFASVIYSWEIAEFKNAEGKIVREVLSEKKCARCDGKGKVDIHEPTALDLEKMATQYPGRKRGYVIDLPYQVMPDHSLEELPYELADSIRHDDEYRATSRVQIMYDPLPDSEAIGSVLDHNAQIELFGLQYSSKLQRMEIRNLNIEISMLKNLQGGTIGGPGQAPQQNFR